MRPALHGLARAAVRSYGAWGVDVFRRATSRAPGPLRSLAEQSYALVHQDYRGDITVVPRFRWSLYRKVLSNPSRDDLDRFIDAGRRSVWPLVAQIRDQTRIRRAFEEALGDEC